MSPVLSRERVPMTTPVLESNHLRCEHRRALLDVEATWPRLEWALEAEQRGQERTAHQLPKNVPTAG